MSNNLQLVSDKGQETVARPQFSILHATAHRLPFAWVDTWRAWSKAAVNPQDHEYIISVHESDLAKVREGAESIPESETGIPIVIIYQRQRYCSVDNWNEAAAVSKGKVLILGADDFFPPDQWDEDLLEVIRENNLTNADVEYVLHVGTGSPRDESLIVHPIMSRALYQRWGYFYYPQYESMFADDDFTAHAKADPSITIINARSIVFDHRHPVLGKGVIDEGYREQNKQSAYQTGSALFEYRKQYNFRNDISVTTPAQRKTIAMCLPGEQFSATWVRYFAELMYVLGQNYNIVPLFSSSSNVYVTRMGLVEMVMGYKDHSIDYVLWIDDDNLVTPDQVKLLIHDLESLPEADMVAGWTWIVHDVFNTSLARVSCGLWHESGACIDIPRAHMESNHGFNLIEIDWTGFPCVLMRRELLTKAGPTPFAPIASPHTPYGFSGEDTAFCRVAKDRSNARFFVDRRVKVPHLKLRSAEPNDLLIDRESNTVRVSA